MLPRFLILLAAPLLAAQQCFAQATPPSMRETIIQVMEQGPGLKMCWNEYQDGFHGACRLYDRAALEPDKFEAIAREVAEGKLIPQFIYSGRNVEKIAKLPTIDFRCDVCIIPVDGAFTTAHADFTLKCAKINFLWFSGDKPAVATAALEKLATHKGIQEITFLGGGVKLAEGDVTRLSRIPSLERLKLVGKIPAVQELAKLADVRTLASLDCEDCESSETLSAALKELQERRKELKIQLP